MDKSFDKHITVSNCKTKHISHLLPAPFGARPLDTPRRREYVRRSARVRGVFGKERVGVGCGRRERNRKSGKRTRNLKIHKYNKQCIKLHTFYGNNPYQHV